MVLNQKSTMMKKIFTLIITCCLLSTSISDVLGQRAKLRYADKQSELSNFIEAAKGYEKAYDKKASYRAAKGTAESYEGLSFYKEAYHWWKLVVQFEESTSDDFSNYIFATHQAGNFDEVKTALKNASPQFDSTTGNFHMDSLKVWYSNPKNIELVSLEAFNSSFTEFGIAFDKDGNTYFSSDRGNISSTGKKPIRIDGVNNFNTKKYDMTGRDFIGIYKMNGKQQIAPIHSLVPETHHFSDPYFMKERPIMFYTLTRNVGKVKENRNYSIYPELFFSNINEKGDLVDFNPFPENSPIKHGIINPFLDEQEKRLYFSSNRSEGFGGYDLYYVTYDDDFNFGSPVNLGPSINTSGDERDPFMFRDGFYFSSDGHIGLGGLDIFHAQYQQGAFSHIRNLGLPYNSPQDDFGLIISEEGKSYLSSNRLNGSGLDDIYQIEDLYRRFMGMVRDQDGNLIGDGLLVELRQSDDMSEIATQQKEKGQILADISPEKDFQLVLKKEGYFPVKDNTLSTKGLQEDQIEKDYVMTKIPYKSIFFEDLIFYNLDQSTLRADAEPILDNIAHLMETYSFLNILVRSHADSRASHDYNEALSEKRANAVKEFLNQYGIEGFRVRSDWYGEEKLLNDCGDGVPCPESAHQINRRSELILIAYPDENKAYELPEGHENPDLPKQGNPNLTLDGE
jgi:outer membrane protein OmpA-like peptidoglycan-associated protein